MSSDSRKKPGPYIVQIFDPESGWIIASRHKNEIPAVANFEVRCQRNKAVRLILDGKIIREQSEHD